jgi:hypothetical protein
MNPRIPKEKSIQAMDEAREGKGKKYETVDEMFADLGTDAAYTSDYTVQKRSQKGKRAGTRS